MVDEGLEKSGRNLTGEIMIIPIRCFSCGKLIADKYDKFIERVKKGDSAKKVLDELGLDRYCCRRMIVSHAELIDEVAKFRGIV